MKDESQWGEVIQSTEPTLVRFTASWCKPCKQLEPEYYLLLKEESSLRSITVDIDEFDTISAEAKVTAIPCFNVYQSGKIVKSWGDGKADTMRSMMNEYMSTKKDK